MKPVGSHYRLFVAVKFEERLINQEIRIEVTEYNQFTPRLNQKEYR